jgi:hypothetical protein
MDMLETVVWVVAGFMVVAAVPAVIYFLLPPAFLEIAERHGRYAGLGGRGTPVVPMGGHRARRYELPLGRRA